jgi:hypothetical protein
MECPGGGDENEEYGERRVGEDIEGGSPIARGRADRLRGSEEGA